MQLDPQQRAAVETDSFNALVIAGAGSGKTRVLIERIAHLIEHCGVSPYEILCLTFTRKAAGEMRERLKIRIGPRAHHVEMGTMHAVALRMLHRFGDVIGFRADKVTVYSEWEESFLLREVAMEIGVYRKGWKIPKKDIDRMFADYCERDIEPAEDDPGAPLFRTFIARCWENNALTYGGLLVGLETLIPTLAKYLRIRHVLVDEVQDIDPLQWRIINRLWDAFRAALFVVGDLRQSIYSFRGAVPEYLARHKDSFRIYELQSNYRSVPEIVTAANLLIEHSKTKLGDGMIAVQSEGGEVGFLQDCDSSALARELASWVGINWSRLAILARNHALLRRISDELTARNIPHIYIGRNSALTNSEEFRRFHAFLKLLVNPYDNFSFLLIRELIGLSFVEYGEIRAQAATDGESHFKTWFNFRDTNWNRFFFACAEWPLEQILATLYDLTSISQPYEFGLQWTRENPFGTIQQYLDWLATYDIQDDIPAEQEGLTLSTIHGAKGLEWPSVIVAGCNEGIIPSKQAIAANEIEEERRLMYVAMTRARDQLILAVRPTKTESNGRIYENPISRFVVEAQV